MDDAYSINFSSAWAFNCFYSKYSNSTIYLYLILNMIKIFKIIRRIGINILVRLILGAAYFILLFPFAVFVKLCTDFLGIREKLPRWLPHKKIENINEFLNQQ